MDRLPDPVEEFFRFTQDLLKNGNEVCDQINSTVFNREITIDTGDRSRTPVQSARSEVSQDINSTELRERTSGFREYLIRMGNALALIDVTKEREGADGIAHSFEKVLGDFDKSESKGSASKPTSSGTHAHSSGTKKTSGKSSSFPADLDKETVEALETLELKADRLPHPDNIRSQYHKCCRKYHLGQKESGDKEKCKQKIQEATTAYELLKDKGLAV